MTATQTTAVPLTITQVRAAEMLGVSLMTINRMIHAGKLRIVKVSQRPRVVTASVLALLDEPVEAK